MPKHKPPAGLSRERIGEGGHPLRPFHPLSWGLITAPIWFVCEGCAIAVHRPVGLLDARKPADQFCNECAAMSRAMLAGAGSLAQSGDSSGDAPAPRPKKDK